MHEALRNQDPSQIPSEWQFPERGKPGLKVFQLALDQRFLVTNLPGNPGTRFNPEYKDHYGGYFFSAEGVIVEELHHLSNHTSYIRYADVYSSVSISPSSVFSYQESGIISYINTFPSELVRQGSVAWYEAFVEYDGRSAAKDDQEAAFAKEVHITNRFMIPIRDAEGLIPSPGLVLQVSQKQSGLSTQDWIVENIEYLKRHNDFGRGLYYGFAPHQDRPNSIFFRDERDIDIYHTTWNVEDGIDGKEVHLEEEHLPTGVKRVAQAPLVVDKRKITTAFLTQPPYPQEENGALMIPWKGMDRLIGASLGYVYPPPKKGY